MGNMRSGKMGKTPTVRDSELRMFRQDRQIPFESKRAAKAQQAMLHKARVNAEKLGHEGLRSRMLKIRPAEPAEQMFGPDTWILESTDTRETWAKAQDAEEKFKKHVAKMRGRGRQEGDEGEGIFDGYLPPGTLTPVQASPELKAKRDKVLAEVQKGNKV